MTPGEGRILFIVSRQHRTLHNYVSYRLGGEPAIEVIRDRRGDERRRRERPVALERRQGQRRVHDVSSSLMTLGYAVVRRPLRDSASTDNALTPAWC
jgi:hypothetical protein